MVFRDDMQATVKRILVGELTDLTEDEVDELAEQVVTAIDLDHEIIEDEDDFPGAEDEDEDDDFISDDMNVDDEG